MWWAYHAWIEAAYNFAQIHTHTRAKHFNWLFNNNNINSNIEANLNTWSRSTRRRRERANMLTSVCLFRISRLRHWNVLFFFSFYLFLSFYLCTSSSAATQNIDYVPVYISMYTTAIELTDKHTHKQMHTYFSLDDDFEPNNWKSIRYIYVCYR